MTFSRRHFLLAGALPTCMPSISVAMARKPSIAHTLVMAETPVAIVDGGLTPAYTFNGQIPAPTLRLKQGERARIAVHNHLPQSTTIHWHGIRIRNDMDGVPGLTQQPIAPGESFLYDFVAPDAGTFWYHPHLHSLEQMSKGLVGPLIVEERQHVAFDADVVIGLKDWLLDDKGQFLPFSTPRNAARMGTLGNVQGVNGKVLPTFDVPAGGSCRLRFLNMDNTRVYTLSFHEQRLEHQVLSCDGMPVQHTMTMADHPIGAGMRIDVGIIAPRNVGSEITVYDRKGRFHFPLCKLRCIEANNSVAKHIPSLPPNPIPAPDLTRAEALRFVFEWEGALSPTDDAGAVDRIFWTINRRAWEGGHGEHHTGLPEPLAVLQRGRTYSIELVNNTPHQHPIHLHGEIFTVLESNQKTITPHQADTVLLEKNETVRIALRATNPGRWMFHCHVIEHMQTGLMGYITIV